MISLLRLSVRFPRLVVGVLLLLLAVAATLAPRVTLRLEGRALIPEDHPSMEASDREAERFRLRDMILIAVEQADGELSPRAFETVTAVSRELAELEGVASNSVTSLATIPRFYIEDGILDLRPLLDRDTPDAAMAATIRRESSALGLDDGVLLARDHRATAIYAQVSEEADRYQLRRNIQDLAQRHSTPGIAIHYSGTALAQAVLGEAAATDLARLVPLVLLVMALALTAAYRRIVPGLICLAEIGASLIVTIGLMGLTGQSVFVTTLALPVILIVIGVSDDVYALNRYFAIARQKPQAPPAEVALEALSSVRWPILLTALTTSAGLLCLATTDLEPQRVFGIFGAVAVAMSTLLTFTLVPALLVLFGPRPHRPKTRGALPFSERLMERWFEVLRKTPKWAVLVPLVTLLLASLALATRVEVGDSWVANLPPDSQTARGDRAINRLLAGTNTLDLALDSGRPGGVLEAEIVSALGEVENALLASPHVGAVESLYGEIARVTAALEGVPYESFRAALARGDEHLDGPRIEQALLLLDSLGRSPRIDRTDPENRRTRLTVFVNSADYARVGQVLDVAERAGAESFGPERIEPFGDGWIGYTTIRLLVAGQVRSIGLAIATDTVLLVLLFGTLATALIAVSPVVSGVVLVFGTLAASGIPLGTASSMFAAISLGVGIDYSIHLVAATRTEIGRGRSRAEAAKQALLTTGPAILTSSVAIAAGFSLLGISEVMPNRRLGFLVAVAMTACAILTLVLVPFFTMIRKDR